MKRGRRTIRRGIAGAALVVLLLASLEGRAQGGGTMTISSPVFADDSMIPVRFTADGADINPPLVISGVPPGAASLALIVEDPDAPGGTWNHWLLWDIAPGTPEIEERSTPAGAVTGRNDFGSTDYRGPAPPSGTHRYRFRIFALDARLDLPAGASRAELDHAMAGHIMASAALTGQYRR